MKELSFIIDNITDSDVKSRYIRVLKKNKKYFPPEILGQSDVYEIEIIYSNKLYPASYRTCSTGGRVRSGRIIFNKENFDQLSIKSGDVLSFEIIIPNRSYRFLKVNHKKITVALK